MFNVPNTIFTQEIFSFKKGTLDIAKYNCFKYPIFTVFLFIFL